MDLGPVHYALLGLLRRSGAHGYDLQRAFVEGGDLGGIVRLEQGSLYGALKELAAQGLISGREEREGARPPRTVYALTDRGRTGLEDWLRRPVRRMREVRLDFLLKLYFTRDDGPRAVRALLEAQLAACHQYLADLDRRSDGMARDGFAYLVNQSKASAARATVEWLEEYENRLEAGTGAPP